MKKEIIITIAAHVIELGQASTLTLGMGIAGNEGSGGQVRPVYIQTK